jgi:hypothetical protein
MCTGMLFDPVEHAKRQAEKVRTFVNAQGVVEHHKKREFEGNFKLFSRWVRFKQFVLLKAFGRKPEDETGEKKSSFLGMFFFW